MQFKVIPVTPLQQNCTLYWCEDTLEAAVIDPGGEVDRILEAAKHLNLKITKIWLTHGHLDHVGGTGELKQKTNAVIEGPHKGDSYWIDRLMAQSRNFGFAPPVEFQPDRWLVDGDQVSVGNQLLQVRHCPGHTAGHVIFYDEKSKWAQVGDVLFAGSIGRSDLPGGNHEQLMNSILDRLFVLGDNVDFVPGHGPMSTFGEERQSNPFVGGLR